MTHRKTRGHVTKQEVNPKVRKKTKWSSILLVQTDPGLAKSSSHSF